MDTSSKHTPELDSDGIGRFFSHQLQSDREGMAGPEEPAKSIQALPATALKLAIRWLLSQ